MKKFLLVLFLSLAAFLGNFMPALAQYITPSSVTITSPFHTGNTDTIIRNVISRASIIFLFLVGLVFMGMIFYGGFLFLTDGGNEENAKKAKGVIMSAVIGLIIIGITGFILALIQSIFGINLHI